MTPEPQQDLAIKQQPKDLFAQLRRGSSCCPKFWLPNDKQYINKSPSLLFFPNRYVAYVKTGKMFLRIEMGAKKTTKKQSNKQNNLMATNSVQHSSFVWHWISQYYYIIIFTPQIFNFDTIPRVIVLQQTEDIIHL